MKYNILTDSFTTYDNVEIPKVNRIANIDSTIFDNSFYNWVSNVSSTDSSDSNSSQLNINNTQETINNFSKDNDSVSNDISFEELIKQEKLPVRITSSFRKGSEHNHGKKDSKGNSMAYDIVPTNGDFEDLFNKIYSNPRIVNWLKQRNWGVLEELTPDVMRVTKATGKHLHIGPDPWAIRMFNTRLKKYE